MIELNKIYNENCLDTMSRMDDNFIDLTVTSPPYDNLRNYNGYEFDFESIAKELFRVTKVGGVVVWIVGDATINGSETGTSFKQALYFKEIGFNLHDTMIYAKNNIVLTHNRYEQAFEYMFVLSKSAAPKTFNPLKIRTLNPGQIKRYNYTNSNTNNKMCAVRTGLNRISKTNELRYRDNIWFLAGEKNQKEHPAIFPEQLAEDHIFTWSNKCDLVYDPFTGSGTTAKMSIKLDRNYIGSEISKEYCDIADKRINKELIKIKLF